MTLMVFFTIFQHSNRKGRAKLETKIDNHILCISLDKLVKFFKLSVKFRTKAYGNVSYIRQRRLFFQREERRLIFSPIDHLFSICDRLERIFLFDEP